MYRAIYLVIRSDTRVRVTNRLVRQKHLCGIPPTAALQAKDHHTHSLQDSLFTKLLFPLMWFVMSCEYKQSTKLPADYPGRTDHLLVHLPLTDLVLGCRERPHLDLFSLGWTGSKVAQS